MNNATLISYVELPRAEPRIMSATFSRRMLTFFRMLIKAAGAGLVLLGAALLYSTLTTSFPTLPVFQPVMAFFLILMIILGVFAILY